MQDPETGKRRKTWVFIMILSYSRHRFVRFVFRQDSPTWLDCHMRAFSFFRGLSKIARVLDNLKDGVLKPDLYDPTLNPAYAELERHYGFVADPAKVQMARHKGTRGEMCAGGASADPGGASFSGYRGGQRESSGVVSQGSRSAQSMAPPIANPTRCLLEKKPSCCCPCPINPTKRLSGNNAPCIGTAI